MCGSIQESLGSPMGIHQYVDTVINFVKLNPIPHTTYTYGLLVNRMSDHMSLSEQSSRETKRVDIFLTSIQYRWNPFLCLIRGWEKYFQGKIKKK